MIALNTVIYACSRRPDEPYNYTLRTSSSELHAILAALAAYSEKHPKRIDLQDLIEDIRRILKT